MELRHHDILHWYTILHNFPTGIPSFHYNYILMYTVFLPDKKPLKGYDLTLFFFASRILNSP